MQNLQKSFKGRKKDVFDSPNILKELGIANKQVLKIIRKRDKKLKEKEKSKEIEQAAKARRASSKPVKTQKSSARKANSTVKTRGAKNKQEAG